MAYGQDRQDWGHDRALSPIIGWSLETNAFSALILCSGSRCNMCVLVRRNRALSLVVLECGAVRAALFIMTRRLLKTVR